MGDLQRAPGRHEIAGGIDLLLGEQGQQAVEVFGQPLHRFVPRDAPHSLGHCPMGDSDAEYEPPVANDVERQRPLRKQRRVLVLDRHYATGHLDVRNFAQRGGQNGQ